MSTNVDIEVSPIIESELDQVINIGENTPEFKTGTDAAQFYSKETLSNWITDPNGVTVAYCRQSAGVCQ